MLPILLAMAGAQPSLAYRYWRIHISSVYFVAPNDAPEVGELQFGINGVYIKPTTIIADPAPVFANSSQDGTITGNAACLGDLTYLGTGPASRAHWVGYFVSSPSIDVDYDFGIVVAPNCIRSSRWDNAARCIQNVQVFHSSNGISYTATGGSFDLNQPSTDYTYTAWKFFQ